ncbi:efflux RND transporter periplasmic adaptor subunit [Ramlibacter monticola]|uniref:Efflux RND transporter periplasmic adaptor subunit n=1 Tax=Ramlibacter monticola TaxID=1926872 RepID=A0A936YUK2_9BURK|nr:efflux RND transporter periplasmic adaptor subunit [Ramlibacter monticola]MBL0390233.1 efflux RND transporter periplasmic adaptor subunit [Ramlibacter monticola]
MPASATRQSSRWNASTVRAAALHAVIVLASLVAASIMLVACGPDASHARGQPGAGGPPPAVVVVTSLVATNLAMNYEYVGQTAGSRDVEVRARVAGILLARNFTEGGSVRKGQSLYSLDPAPFQAAFNRAEAEVAAAEARLAQATRTLNRLRPLAEARAVSQRDYDDAASAEQVAHAELKAAQARRAEAALNLVYTKVEAPLSGAAGRSQVSEGTLVAGPGTLLTTLTQTDPMKVRFGIADTDQMKWRNEAAAGRLQLPPHEAFTIEIKLADGSLYPRKGKLLFSDTRVSGNTGTVEAEAEVPNPDGVLKPGQFVRVRLTGATRLNALLVPSRAVLEGPQGKFVYLAADGKAAPRPVQVGDQIGDDWVVNSGLAAGDPVIVDGMARIFFPGAPIQVAQTPAGAKATAGDASAPAAAARPAK